MARKDKRGGFRTTTQAGRLLRLTGMTTSVATRVATHSVRGFFRSDEDQAKGREKLMRDIGREVASTLGEMKGAVMKVGQVASQMKDILPDEVAEALAVLQKSSAPMPFSVIRRQIRKELGDEPEALFNHFDEEPFASASIGQVHRATTQDGREVVVKVQYPAVRESVNSDMKQLRRILRLGGLLKVEEKVLDQIFDEIRNQLEEELDYDKEAAHVKLFHDFHRNNPWLVIPEVVDERTTDRVLTLTYEPGDDLDTLRNAPEYDQQLRNHFGKLVFDTIGEQMFRLGTVHCDPHPGNFAYRKDGRLVIYDFGAVKRISESDLAIFRRAMRAALESDYRGLESALRELGIRKEGGPEVSDDFYEGWVNLIRPAFDEEPFDFSRSRMHIHLARRTRDTPWKYLESFQPSPRTLLVDRVLGGHYWTMVNLGVNTAFRENLERVLEAGQEEETEPR